MFKNVTKILILLLICSSCNEAGNFMSGNIIVRVNDHKKPSIANVKVQNDQLIVTGKNLDSVTIAKVAGHEFQIESKTSDKLILNAKNTLSFLVGSALNLVVSNANASATFPLSFELQNGQVTASKLHHMGASTGEFLQFNGSTWEPASLNTNQVYVGVYNAATDTPNISAAVAAAGTYYIVTTAGAQDLGSGLTNFDVGDWVISDGTNWSKVSVGTNTVSNFNGRTGAVVPLSGDYSWSMLTKAAGKLTGSKLQEIADIDAAGVQDGDILQWNAGTLKWEVNPVPAPVISAGSISNTQIANSAVDSNKIVDGTIVNADISATAAIDQSKINGLTTDLNNKEPKITAGTAAQYWTGNKTWQNFNPAVLGSTLTGFASTTGAVSAADSVLSAFNKLTGNLGVVAAAQGNYVLKAGDTMSGPLAMGNNKITGLGTPTNPTDAATMAYVDSKVGTASQWTTTGANIHYNTGSVGVGTSAPEAYLHVASPNYAPGVFERTSTVSTNGRRAGLIVLASTTQDMVDGFGSHIDFSVKDSANVNNMLGSVGALRSGADNSGSLYFMTNNLGSSQIHMAIDNLGRTGLGTTTPTEKLDVVGNVALTGKVRLKSDTVNYVELQAPNGLTGNLNFRLPAGAGTSGQALTTDGAGNLAWSTVSNGTPADGSVTYAKLNLADGDIPLTKLAGASDATKYLKGDKSWGTFITDVLAATFATVTPSNTAIANGDSLQTVVNKTQGQISNLASNSLNKTGTDSITGTLTINAATGALKIPSTPSGVDLTDAANVQYVQNYVDIFGKWIKNGTSILYNGGNVGIGPNATPTAKFEVNDNVDGILVSKVENSNSGTAAFATQNVNSDGAGIGMESYSSTFTGNWGTVPKADSVAVRSHVGAPASNMLVGTSTAIPLHLMVQSAPRMTFLPNGYSGIGTTAPNHHFEVSTELDSLTKMGIFNTHATGTVTNTQLFASNEKNSIAMGILGTANTNTGYGSPGDSYIYNSGGTATGKNFNIINNQTTGAIKFYNGSTANGTPRMMIDSAGNVGIGLNSPASFLHLFSDATSFKEMKIDAARNNSGAYGITFAKSRGNSIARTQTLANDALGDLNFIGFTDAGVVAPDSSARIRALAEENLTATGYGGALAFQTVTAGTATMVERMRINSLGNVGIGTAIPGHKLTVLDAAASNDTAASVFNAGLGADATLGSINFNVWGTPSATAANRHVGIVAADHVGVRPLVLNMASNGLQGNVGIGTTKPQALLEVSSPGNSIINNSISDDTKYAALRMFTLRGNTLETMGSANPSAGNKGWELGANGNNYPTAALRNVLTMNHWNGTVWSTPMAILPTGDVGIGTTAPGYKLHVNGSVAGVGAYNALSDRRYKKEFEKIPDALERIVALNGFYYKWKQQEYPDMEFEKGRDMGVIAQEVEKVFPEAVSTAQKSGIKSVAYSKLIAPLIEAIKELFFKSESQKREIASLKQEVQSLQEQNELMKEALCETNPNARICRVK